MQTETKDSQIDDSPPPSQRVVSGLGGWLIVVQYAIYWNLLGLVIHYWNYILPSLFSEIWGVLTSKDSELYHPLWGTAIGFEIIYTTLFILTLLYALVLLYKKKSLFPKMMIAFHSTVLLVTLIELAIMSQIPPLWELEGQEAARDIYLRALTCAIWIPYYLLSKRVRNTFVN